jgi:TP901 family phage tail tape measure protein
VADVTIVIKYRDTTGGDRKKTADGLGDIGKSADESKGKLSAFGEVTTGALRKVGEFAVSSLASAGQALVGFVGDSVKKAGDYESSMNMFAAVTGATADQMAAAKQEAKDLGADLTLPATSAASAGEAMTELAKAGLSVQDSLAAAKGTLQLAAAGNISEAEAAQTAAAALNEFHLAGSEAVRVADLLAASVSASGSSVTQTGQAVQQAGASFAAAHVPIEDFVTLINEMSKSGIKGSDAGTSLKTMLMRLQAPTKEAADQMRELGIHVYDAQGKMLPMRDIIGQFSTSLAGLTQKQRDQAVVTIFGSDAQRAANIVLAGGVDAYDKMRIAVTRQNAAADLAAAKMKGLNGSIEGFQSQVETLMLEALEPLLPVLTAGVDRASAFAASFQGSVGPAVSGAIDFLSAAAHVAGDVFVPAVGAATAAVIGYGVSAVAPMLVNIPAMTAVLIYQTSAWLANAAAVALAAAPYVVLAAAVGGAIYLYQQFNEQVETGTQKLLESKPWWSASTKAITDFGNQADASREKLAPYAATITELRTEIEADTEALAKDMAMGKQARESSAQYEARIQAEMAAIRAKKDGLIQATDAYNQQEQAILKAAAATQTGTARLAEMQQGEQQITEETELTEKEFEKLAKQLQKTFEDGSKAVGDYVGTELAFMQDLEKFHEDHDAKTLQQQALTYALESAAQRAHLGQMLSDYTLTQVQMGNINRETGEKILAQIESQFGVQKDLSAETFLAMTADIDKAANEGGAALDNLGKNLGGVTTNAVETKAKMDALAKKYTAELIHNFEQGKISAEDLRRELQDIPSKVYSEVVVTTTHREKYETGGVATDDASGGTGRRASGGPVLSGTPYVVGERGPELFVPDTGGTIVPNGRTPAGMGGGNTYILQYYGQAGLAPQEDVEQALKIQQLLFG